MIPLLPLFSTRHPARARGDKDEWDPVPKEPRILLRLFLADEACAPVNSAGNEVVSTRALNIGVDSLAVILEA